MRTDDDMQDDPDWMQPITGALPEEVHGIVRRLLRSCSREHLLYREAELDDLWRHAQMEARRRATGRQGEPEEYFARMERLVFEAHDLTAAGLTDEAAAVLVRAVAGASPEVPS